MNVGSSISVKCHFSFGRWLFFEIDSPSFYNDAEVDAVVAVVEQLLSNSSSSRSGSKKNNKDAANSTIIVDDIGILDYHYIIQLWEEHQSKKYDRSQELWRVLCFISWFKRYR